MTNYRSYRHGEAVAVGMVAATAIAARMGYCDPSLMERIRGLLLSLGLPVELPGLPAGELITAMGRDKKVAKGRVGFVLPRDFGAVEWGCQAPDEVVREVLVELGAGVD